MRGYYDINYLSAKRQQEMAEQLVGSSVYELNDLVDQYFHRSEHAGRVGAIEERHLWADKAKMVLNYKLKHFSR